MNFTSRGGKQTPIVGLLDHHLKLLGGAHQRVAVGRNNSQHADDFFGGAVEKINPPPEGIQKPMKGPRNQQRDAFGPREAQALGHQLAQHHLQHGEQTKREDQSHAVRDHSRPRARNRFHKGPEDACQRDFTDVAKRQAGDGNAHLYARNDAAEVAEERFDDLGTGVPLLDELADA